MAQQAAKYRGPATGEPAERALVDVERDGRSTAIGPTGVSVPGSSVMVRTAFHADEIRIAGGGVVARRIPAIVVVEIEGHERAVFHRNGCPVQ